MRAIYQNLRLRLLISSRERFIFVVAIVLMFAAGISANAIFNTAKSESPAPTTTEESTTAQTTTEESTTAPQHGPWLMEVGDYGNKGHWIKDGSEKIRNAKTPEESREAAEAFLDRVKRDPNLITGAIWLYFQEPLDQTRALIDEWGYATSYSVELHGRLKEYFEESAITSEDAPADAYNTGTRTGVVQPAQEPGITGDRTAIKVVAENGEVTYILAKCANPVVTKLLEKNPQEDPYPRGNAPVGGGPNADPGPGEYIPPESMSRPPAETRVNLPPPTTPPVSTAAPPREESTTAPETTKPSTTTTAPETTKPATTKPATTSPQETSVNQSEVTHPWD